MEKGTSWQKFLKLTASPVALAVFTLLSYFELYVAAGSAYFEGNRTSLFGMSFVTALLLSAQVILTLYFGVSTYFSAYYRGIKRNGAVAFGAEIIALLLLAASFVIQWGGGTACGSTYLMLLPYFLIGLGAAVVLFLIPLAKERRWLFVVLVCVPTVVIGLSISAAMLDNKELEFEQAPAVFDTGSDFSVVWCTDKVSIGYLEYEYEGKKYTVYDATDGRYNADKRVHTVHVPYEHLYGNSYSVSSARVLRNTPYTSKTGEFIKSGPYVFAQKVTSDKLKMISASDWHEDTESLYKAVDACGEYDLLLMMGDPVNHINEQDKILDNIIVPAGRITGGVKPILYVRGNHEPRGKYAEHLKEILGYENFYYTASYGEQNFIVFDGGEDKADSDSEYGGLIVSEPYRKAELDYMDALPVMEGYNICLCHIPRYTIAGNTEERARFDAILEKQNVKLEISGHRHELDYITGEKYDTLVDGGPIKGDGYVLCYVTVDGGKATIEAIGADGKKRTTYGPTDLK